MSDKDHITEEEYIQLDLADDRPNEYANGEMIRREGRSLRHNRISSNILMSLGTQLRDVDAFVFASLMRVFIKSTRSYRFPDVGVGIAPLIFDDKTPESLLNPTVLIEITSDFTEYTDYVDKFDEYLTIPSLDDYLIISQDEARIFHYQRYDYNRWLFTIIKDVDTTLTLKSSECTLALQDIYHDVQFDLDDG